MAQGYGERRVKGSRNAQQIKQMRLYYSFIIEDDDMI